MPIAVDPVEVTNVGHDRNQLAHMTKPAKDTNSEGELISLADRVSRRLRNPGVRASRCPRCAWRGSGVIRRRA